MAALSPTNVPSKHVLGDIVVRFYNFTTVNTGDTLTIAGLGGTILQVSITPNTAAGGANDPAATWTGSVVTFLSAGAWGGTVSVFSRTG
jgi:hypothetical protein